MSRLRIALALLVGCVALSPVTIQAQDSGRIAYGETVQGELSNQEFEIPYTFSGKAGDVIVIEMGEVDRSSDLNYPAVILLDSDGAVVGAAEGLGGSVTFAGELPAEGAYTILATRRDGRSGDSAGVFYLTLLSPPILALSTPVDATARSAEVSYITIRADGDFALEYVRGVGEFHPEITVNTIEDNELRAVATLGGKYLESGIVRLRPPAGETIFVLRVARQLFDIILNETTTEYNLKLQYIE